MDNIKIILPPGISPDEFRELMSKSIPVQEVQESFDDPVITHLARNLVAAHEKMYTELLTEVESLLDSEYRDLPAVPETRESFGAWKKKKNRGPIADIPEAYSNNE